MQRGRKNRRPRPAPNRQRGCSRGPSPSPIGFPLAGMRPGLKGNSGTRESAGRDKMWHWTQLAPGTDPTHQQASERTDGAADPATGRSSNTAAGRSLPGPGHPGLASRLCRWGQLRRRPQACSGSGVALCQRQAEPGASCGGVGATALKGRGRLEPSSLLARQPVPAAGWARSRGKNADGGRGAEWARTKALSANPPCPRPCSGEAKVIFRVGAHRRREGFRRRPPGGRKERLPFPTLTSSAESRGRKEKVFWLLGRCRPPRPRASAGRWGGRAHVSGGPVALGLWTREAAATVTNQ